MISFGVIADCQYADTDILPGIDRHFRDAGRRIAEAVEELNRHELAFVVHLGDLIDFDLSHAAVPLAALADSSAPVHHVLGNHDFAAVPGGARVNEVTDILTCYGMPASYYSFTVADPDGPVWRFVCCDSNEDSAIRHPVDSAEHRAVTAELERAHADGAINARPWNGTVSTSQRAWLSGQLTAAQAAGERVVIFVHHQPYPLHRDSMLDGADFIAELATWPCVVAVMSGHNHDGDYGRYEGVHVVTLHGMVETATTAYAIATLTDEAITIRGFGRQPDRDLRLDN